MNSALRRIITHSGRIEMKDRTVKREYPSAAFSDILPRPSKRKLSIDNIPRASSCLSRSTKSAYDHSQTPRNIAFGCELLSMKDPLSYYSLEKALQLARGGNDGGSAGDPLHEGTAVTSSVRGTFPLSVSSGRWNQVGGSKDAIVVVRRGLVAFLIIFLVVSGVLQRFKMIPSFCSLNEIFSWVSKHWRKRSLVLLLVLLLISTSLLRVQTRSFVLSSAVPVFPVLPSAMQARRQALEDGRLVLHSAYDWYTSACSKHNHVTLIFIPGAMVPREAYTELALECVASHDCSYSVAVLSTHPHYRPFLYKDQVLSSIRQILQDQVNTRDCPNNNNLVAFVGHSMGAYCILQWQQELFDLCCDGTEKYSHCPPFVLLGFTSGFVHLLSKEPAFNGSRPPSCLFVHASEDEIEDMFGNATTRQEWQKWVQGHVSCTIDGSHAGFASYDSSSFTSNSSSINNGTSTNHRHLFPNQQRHTALLIRAFVQDTLSL